MKKKILITMLCVLTLTGCGKIPKLENGQEVIVSLDGKSISVDELYQELKKQGGTSVLVSMIDNFIANKEYETTEEMKEEIDEEYESTKVYYEKLYGTDFATILLQSGFDSEDAYKEYLLANHKQKLIVEAYVKGLLTEEEIQKYYDEKVTGKITAKHILIKPEVTDSMSTDEKKEAEEKALKEAKDLIEQLNNGADFSTLAKEHSDDTASAEKGGALDPFDHNSNLVDSFKEAAIALENGKYSSEPVKSSYGYHIILKESTEEKPSLEKTKEEIKTTLMNEKLSADSENLLTYKAMIDIRKKYNLNIIDTDLSKIYDASISKYKD